MLSAPRWLEPLAAIEVHNPPAVLGEPPHCAMMQETLTRLNTLFGEWKGRFGKTTLSSHLRVSLRCSIHTQEPMSLSFLVTAGHTPAACHQDAGIVWVKLRCHHPEGSASLPA